MLHPDYRFRNFVAKLAIAALAALGITMMVAPDAFSMTSGRPVITIRDERLERIGCNEDGVLVPVDVTSERTRYVCVVLDDFADAASMKRLDDLIAG